MWPGFDPTLYTREQYAAHVASLPASALSWVKFIVLHNTGSPTLEQWLDGGVSEAQRLINLERYYDVTEHWHAGPHGFISPTHICGFSDPTKPGVHASCFNSISLGFEMVGDYSTESFTSGPGSQVRDNAVFALALWHRKLNLRPDGYRYGVCGLHFHHDCLRDHHACPGGNVDRADMVARVLAQMGTLGGATPQALDGATLGPLTRAPAPPSPPPPISTYLRLGSSGVAVAALQRELGLVVDGRFGKATESAVQGWQAAHSLIADGVVGPVTAEALVAGATK